MKLVTYENKGLLKIKGSIRPITTAERTITQSRIENLKIVWPKNPKNNTQNTITN